MDPAKKKLIMDRREYMRCSETIWITDNLYYYYDSKSAGDDFLAGVLSEGEEDALIDMDIWLTSAVLLGTWPTNQRDLFV
jgi:hypothetical protein